jgi:hypothetical protein
MPFPYTFPFYFDNTLKSTDSGAGGDESSMALNSDEEGTGTETVLEIAAAVCASDGGSGRDAFIESLEKAAKSAVTGAGDRREGKIPSRLTGMKSRRINI